MGTIIGGFFMVLVVFFVGYCIKTGQKPLAAIKTIFGVK